MKFSAVQYDTVKTCIVKCTDLDFFCALWNFGSTGLAEKNAKITTSLKLRQNSVNQIFYPNAFVLPFERCYMILQCYLRTIYIFASFIGYEDDIVEVISN